jgi:hypothetical protein
VTFDDTIAITLDVDWAPEAAIAAAAETLERAGVRATFFATHASEVLGALDPDLFEIGLHPNFNDAGAEVERPIAELKDLYPKAQGARSHSLFVSSRILGLYRAHGLRYEANVFLDGHPHLRPVMRFADLVSIPFNWSDDKHLERERPFDIDAVGLGRPGLKVFNFHPIHVFMNTTSDAHYAAYRPHYRDADELREHIADGPGIGTLFWDLVEALGNGAARVSTMREIGERCLASA